jgi:hypothetical protein
MRGAAASPLTLFRCAGAYTDREMSPRLSYVAVGALVVLISASCSVAPLERHAALDTLAIPPLEQVNLTPVFASGFEHDSDFAGFYVTPQSPFTRHQVVSGGSHAGTRAHVGWLTGAIGSEPVDGPNHRGYPTIQLPKRPVGTCVTPCLVQFWARLSDVDLGRGEWFSLATFSSDPSDRWSRVITVNVGWEGWLHLFHVPDPGIGDRVLQRTDIPFPQDRWVRITTWLDLDPDHGAAAVWQDGVLVSAARVNGGDGSLDQMHFGLYAPPSLTSATVINDDIAVFRVTPRS